MAVLMTMRVHADPKKLEEVMAGNPDEGVSLAARAKEHGLIAHRFYGSEDGQIMVLDEWPDAESFDRFFEENRSRIEPMMQAVGAQGAPEVTIWRELDTPDKVGWNVE